MHKTSADGTSRHPKKPKTRTRLPSLSSVFCSSNVCHLISSGNIPHYEYETCLIVNRFATENRNRDTQQKMHATENACNRKMKLWHAMWSALSTICAKVHLRKNGIYTGFLVRGFQRGKPFFFCLSVFVHLFQVVAHVVDAVRFSAPCPALVLE